MSASRPRAAYRHRSESSTTNRPPPELDPPAARGPSPRVVAAPSLKQLSSSEGRIYPKPPSRDPRDEMSSYAWGFRDTSFGVDNDGAIIVTGKRYPGLSGETLPELLPWFRKVVGIDFVIEPGFAPAPSPFVPAPRPAPEFLDRMRAVLNPDQIVTDDEVRLRH